MRTIGILGGMSWESTAFYYKGINEEINSRLEGLHSGKILIYSVNFEHIETMQRQDHFEMAGKFLARHALTLQNAGAEGIILATNTMHKVADLIQDAIDIPFLHIADSTIKEIKLQNKNHALLLGTRFTMLEDFYKERFLDSRIDISILDTEIALEIDRIIFEELCLGIINPSSKKFILKCIEQISKNDPSIQGVILGCTELNMLISQEDTDLTIFDTTALHVRDSVDFMLTKVLSPLSIPNA